MSRPTDTATGFTLVLCGAGGCYNDVAAEARSMLRGYVKTTPHGVLVVSGCSLSPALCRFRAEGPLLIVQPCDAGRQPTSPLIRVGPIRTIADVVALRQWLRGGRLDADALPRHLTGLHRSSYAAASN
jgi:hypothetical protein